MWKTLIKNIYILVTFIAIIPNIVYAQSNFTPLNAEDVEIKDDPLIFFPGFKVSGGYRLHVTQIQGDPSALQESEIDDPKGLKFQHELRFNLSSTVHRHISINLELDLKQDPIQGADIRTKSSATENETTDSQTANIQARQAYLEYNSNPANILRFGKQYINIGDHKGKVFSGILTGVSQNCKLGTWCYQLGGMKLGTHPADWLYYGALDYPVFDETNYKLDVAVYRILYTERDVPLGKFNGPTFKNQTELTNLSTASKSGDASTLASARSLARQATDRDGKPIYYDAIEQQYFGLNLNWRWAGFHLNFDAVANQGQRRYHINTREAGVNSSPSLGSNTEFKLDHRSRDVIAATAFEMDMFYQFKVNQIGLRYLHASGDSRKEDASDEGENYLRLLNGYYEITPGNYRGTNFYFNGSGGNDLTQGTGLGHSINNITMYGGWFKTEADPVEYELRLFQLERTNPVLNVDNVQVKDIGVEWDNTITFNLDKSLSSDLEINVFFPGGAFTYDDNETPLKNQPVTYHVVSRLQYSF